ncbi:MAG: carbamoyl phosphate synthase small subunit, partial [Oscillospiraceae bacterium]|nr:carbamoyl phosphate synthase small subunit [Oscillospiraceae bacterium]
MIREYDKKIILEDGAEFYGFGFGDDSEKIVEVVFNTSMVGYQEILSDPSYTGQAVVMTYPLIGNYGICTDDYETKVPTISALIVREYNEQPSNFRAEETLEQVMQRHGIAGIAGVDTRRLARHIRDKGTCKGLITQGSTPNLAGLARLHSTHLPTNQVQQVSTKTSWVSPAEKPKYHVVAVDCGIKHNIIRSLNQRNCDVTIVPWNTTAENVEQLHPDGIFLSNGPGNP